MQVGHSLLSILSSRHTCNMLWKLKLNQWCWSPTQRVRSICSYSWGQLISKCIIPFHRYLTFLSLQSLNYSIFFPKQINKSNQKSDFWFDIVCTQTKKLMKRSSNFDLAYFKSIEGAVLQREALIFHCIDTKSIWENTKFM